MAKTILAWIGEYKFVVALDRTMTREVVCARGRAAGPGFAFDIVSRICDCFFVGLNDLEREYADYYNREYSSLATFLFRKYGLPDGIIQSMLANKTDETIIALGDASGGGDYTLSQLAEGEVGQELLTTLLDLDRDPGSDVEDREYEDEE